MSNLAEDLLRRRQEYYRKIASQSLRPLWESLHTLVPTQPRTRCVPSMWKFEDLRPPLLESGELISAKEATRRVLVLENPGCPGESRVTNSLYAGVQLLKPGEVAPAHRHTQSALRFVLEGRGAFTAVNGEQHLMAPGDLILTPSWSWHDHGSEGHESVIWLDGLDIPMLQMFDAGFCEELGEDQQPITRPRGDSLARFGANMLPADYAQSPLASPVFAYPFARTREALYQLSKYGNPNPRHGYRMRYINPVTGGHALPTIASFMQLLPAQFSGRSFRSTDATVYVCVEGAGRTIIGDQVYEWKACDIFVVPSWHSCRHECAGEAVLFSYSDRAVQEQLGLWREAFD